MVEVKYQFNIYLFIFLVLTNKYKKTEEELTVAPLMNAIEQFNVTAAFLASERLSLEAAIAKSTSRFSTTLIAAITHYNERAKLAERNFTTASGLDNQV